MVKGKFRLVSLLILLIVVITVLFRSSKPNTQLVNLSGQTMGTIRYQVKYFDVEDRHFQSEVDSILVAFNQILSTYITTSEISLFNISKKDTFPVNSSLFSDVIEKSFEVYNQTDGYFDPTVAPLVNAWGFGPKDRKQLDSTQVKEIMQTVGMHSIRFEKRVLFKRIKEVNLDFSAIAKGQAVDLISDFLLKNGIENFMVEIGGELRVHGKKDDESLWKIGIQDPRVDKNAASKLFATVNLEDLAVATSGNYRNYYEQDGKLIAHIIDPKTGYPAETNMLSASVFSLDCMTADAYATAFMAMGFKKAQRIIRRRQDLDAFFIYSDQAGDIQIWISDELKRFVELRPLH